MGLSLAAVYRAIEDGDLVAYRVRNRLRVQPSELAAFKERERVRPRRPQAPAYEPQMADRPSTEGDSFEAELRAIRGGEAA